jgi:hypothetical protein
MIILQTVNLVRVFSAVGLGWENGTPLLLETGKTYNIDSPTFSYAGSQFMNAPVIKHGSINIVTVKQGQAGISYEQGVLNVLPTGRHCLMGATQLFAGFLGLGQQVLKISQVVSMTSDNVGISFDAAVSIQASFPRLCAALGRCAASIISLLSVNASRLPRRTHFCRSSTL